jgi:hypothetical protein
MNDVAYGSMLVLVKSTSSTLLEPLIELQTVARFAVHAISPDVPKELAPIETGVTEDI